ncbi:MAG: aminoacyl-tRNA hydrolase [Dehalococcoidia bacterium]
MRERFGQFRARRANREALEEPTDLDGEEALRPRLVVGFGNPGERYASTRHNVGQWCLRLLARRHHVQLERRGRIDAASVDLEGPPSAVSLVLVRARTYYNDGGPSIAAEVRRLRLRPSQVLAVYDEVDLPVGQLRIRKAGSSGGNNGMKSLIAALGTSEFPRIRIGIDRPYDDGVPVRDPERVADWVLSRPAGEDRRLIDEAVERAADAIETAAREGIDIAMNRFNPR